MGGGTKGFCRRLGARLALCGILFYTALIPGHVVSQLVSALITAELGDATDIICRFGGETRGKPDAPGQAKKHCPFCTGAAAFQVAALGAIPAVVLPRTLRGEALAIEDEGTLRRNVLTPQSRGPPSLPA
jgi:hypothetical protein